VLKVLKLQAYPTLTAISSLYDLIAHGGSSLVATFWSSLKRCFVNGAIGAGGVAAVIWDFDGTLADTSQRNLHAGGVIGGWRRCLRNWGARHSISSRTERL